MSTKTTVNLHGSYPGAGSGRRLVLASSSPYRRELLSRLGLPFDVDVPDVVEERLPGEPLAETALRLSEAKARRVASAHPDALIIGSDQLADFGGMAIGKPANHEGAVTQLTMLSGQTIVFHTGVALLDARSDGCQTALVTVTSTFRDLSAAEIEHYLRRDQPYDCAGSVRVEALGITLFRRIVSDDPTALIGLPLIRLTDMLRAAGLSVLGPAASGDGLT